MHCSAAGCIEKYNGATCPCPTANLHSSSDTAPANICSNPGELVELSTLPGIIQNISIHKSKSRLVRFGASCWLDIAAVVKQLASERTPPSFEYRKGYRVARGAVGERGSPFVITSNLTRCSQRPTTQMPTIVTNHRGMNTSDTFWEFSIRENL